MTTNNTFTEPHHTEKVTYSMRNRWNKHTYVTRAFTVEQAIIQITEGFHPEWTHGGFTVEFTSKTAANVHYTFPHTGKVELLNKFDQIKICTIEEN